MDTPDQEHYIARRRNLRISPQKLRLAADLIRGKNLQRASDLLEFTPTKSANLMRQILNNALANAEQRQADLDSLAVTKVTVDKGMVLKRRKPSGRGRMRGVFHRYSHVALYLSERKKG